VYTKRAAKWVSSLVFKHISTQQNTQQNSQLTFSQSSSVALDNPCRFANHHLILGEEKWVVGLVEMELAVVVEE
jgi:hypothetical protein